MKLEQAIAAMREGKKVETHGFVYRIHGTEIQVADRDTGDFKSASILLSSIIDEQFELYEEPKPEVNHQYKEGDMVWIRHEILRVITREGMKPDLLINVKHTYNFDNVKSDDQVIVIEEDNSIEKKYHKYNIGDKVWKGDDIQQCLENSQKPIGDLIKEEKKTGLKGWEALKALEDGKKIRELHWGKKSFIRLKEHDGKLFIFMHYDEIYCYPLDVAELLNDDWEIVE